MSDEHINHLTLSELENLYSKRSEQMFQQYRAVVHGSDVSVKDDCWRRWTEADDCLLNIKRLIQRVSTAP